MPFCNSCGTEYILGDINCSKCNVSLPSIPTKSIEVNNNIELKSPKLKRLFAGIVDLVVVFGIIFALMSSKRLLMLIIVRRTLMIALPSIYLLMKDSLEGKSIGKLLMGIMVFNEKEKKSGSIAESIIRNWYLAIPILGPTLFAIIIGVQIFAGKKQRMGDKAANTIVITDADYQTIK